MKLIFTFGYANTIMGKLQEKSLDLYDEFFTTLSCETLIFMGFIRNKNNFNINSTRKIIGFRCRT